MSVSFETEAKNVGAGDQVLAPGDGLRMLVREIFDEPDGRLCFKCAIADGGWSLLFLDPDETIKVIDA